MPGILWVLASLVLVGVACTTATPTALPTATPTALPSPTHTITPVASGAQSSFIGVAGSLTGQAEWKTDISRHTVPLEELLSRGGRDFIDPIYQPLYESVASADTWLQPDDLVGALQVGDEVRIYPVNIMRWHEVLNDEVGGLPVTVTFCPICNRFITFDRRVDGRTLVFGVSGFLYKRNLVMWDHETESWWSQLLGQALVGEMVGKSLRFVSTQMASWQKAKAQFPNAAVLARESGLEYLMEDGFYELSVSEDVYSDESPVLLFGTKRALYRDHEWVMGVAIDSLARAYPLSELQEAGVINDQLGDVPLLVVFRSGTVRVPLEQGVVYSRRVNGQVLTFEPAGDGLQDRETGTRWTIWGEATDGRLAGQRLEPAQYIPSYWFAWVELYPETSVYTQAEGSQE